MNEVGFLVEAHGVNSQAIKTGYNKKSFEIDITRLPYNYSHRLYGKPRRVRTPSWDQRVEFNNILNELLNGLKVTCNIKSAHYTIRQGNTIFVEKDWENQRQDWERENAYKGYFIEQGQ